MATSSPTRRKANGRANARFGGVPTNFSHQDGGHGAKRAFAHPTYFRDSLA
jgi:hypothetical protein